MSSGETVPVSVVIAARDEAANIAACIESVRWAREIIVVEDGSTDDTAGLAELAGATVLRHPFTTIGGQRNIAIDVAGEEWILVLDADERGSRTLSIEIGDIIKAPSHDAFRVSRRNFFLGREVKHGGWERDRPLRLFRRSVRYNASRVHEHVEFEGEIGEVRSALTHEPYPTIDSYFGKLDRYSKWWAEDRYDRGKRVSAFTVVARPPVRFLTMYLLRGGLLDGAPGAILACMASTSVTAKYARLWALGRKKRSH